MKPIQPYLATVITLLFISGTAVAHDPVFSPGPHVLFKEGVEIHVGSDREKAGQNQQSELSLELTYGLTGEWAAGIALPYMMVENGMNE